VGDKITDIPGSSEYFLGDIIVYCNEAKNAILKVSEESLITHGAVSEQVAKEMASGCRKIFNSEIAGSTTGIAGPAGGSPEKPVGLVWFAVTDGSRVKTERIVFKGDRKSIKEQASQHLLGLIVKFLEESV